MAGEPTYLGKPIDGEDLFTDKYLYVNIAELLKYTSAKNRNEQTPRNPQMVIMHIRSEKKLVGTYTRSRKNRS